MKLYHFLSYDNLIFTTLKMYFFNLSPYITKLKLEGYKQASLSVQKMNYAVRMYRKIGFEIVDENDEEYIMICKL